MDYPCINVLRLLWILTLVSAGISEGEKKDLYSLDRINGTLDVLRPNYDGEYDKDKMTSVLVKSYLLSRLVLRYKYDEEKVPQYVRNIYIYETIGNNCLFFQKKSPKSARMWPTIPKMRWKCLP